MSVVLRIAARAIGVMVTHTMTFATAARLLEAFTRKAGFGQRKVRQYFNEKYYVATYTDVAQAGVDPFKHYMQHGWLEGRNPSSSFCTLFFRDAYLDGAQINPLLYYAYAGGPRSGIETQPASPADFRRLQRTLVADYFDVAFYSRQTGPLDQDPILHYLAAGWRENYAPSPTFDLEHYIEGYAFTRTLAYVRSTTLFRRNECLARKSKNAG